MTEKMMIATANIRPLAAKLNPRKGTAANLEELRESIRSKGILQPLLLRRNPKGKTDFESVIGNRRLQAARELGLKEIPATVREGMTDVEARTISLMEQIQREDLTALDEAGMLAELLSNKKWDRREAVVQLAKELGKSVGYVSRRSNLLSLHPKILSGKAKNFRADWWSSAQLEQLALLPLDDQLQIADSAWGEVPTLDHLKSEVREYTHRLALAPWDIHDETLLPKAGGCAGCPKQSSNAPGLFDEAVSEDPLEQAACQDFGCWADKGLAHVQATVAAETLKSGSMLELVREDDTFEKGTRIKTSPPALIPEYHGKRPKGSPEVLNLGAWAPAKKGDKGAREALVVSGKRSGKRIWIKSLQAASAAKKTKDKAKAKRDAPKESPAKERKRLEGTLEDRRRAWRINHVREWLEKSAKELPAPLGIVEFWRARAIHAYGFEMGMSAWISPKDGKSRIAKFENSREEYAALDLVIWKGVRPRMISALGKAPVDDRKAQDIEAAWIWDVVFGFTPAALVESSEKEIPAQKRLEVLLQDSDKKPAAKQAAKSKTKSKAKKATRKKAKKKATK